jgi:hypothetical protein
MRQLYNFTSFCPSVSIFQFSSFLNHAWICCSYVLVLLDTNARCYVGGWSLTTTWVISAINMSIIFTNNIDTIYVQVSDWIHHLLISTTSNIIIKYQHLRKFETFLIAHTTSNYICFDCTILSVVVRPQSDDNRPLYNFILISIFTITKITVYTVVSSIRL